MAQYTPLAFEINTSSEGVVFDIGSLFEALGALHDQRDARGVRYRLVTVLVFVLLAKLAGENHLRGIAQWVRGRAVLLAGFLALANVQAPHATTYSRVLGQAISIDEFERVCREFFARQEPTGTRVHITLDGKTMRGTIPAAHRMVQALDLWQHPCHLGTRENHHGRRSARPTGIVARHCGEGRRLSLDDQRESAGDTPGHCATVCPRAGGQRV